MISIIDGLPPAFPLFAAAVLVPLLPLLARRVLTVLAPALALPLMYLLPLGESWVLEFLGFRFVWARTDPLSLIFGLVFLVIAVVGNIYGWHRTRAGEQVAGLIYPAGALTVLFAGDLLTMFIAWEIMAVASTLLIVARRREASLRAAQRYLMVHLAAGGLMLLGVLLVIRTTGTTQFDSLIGLGTGAWLILAAFCVNAAVPPLHAWLPDAYPEGSVSGSVFLSAFTTKAAVYCLIRSFAGAEVLVWAGAVMAFYGVVFAVLENNIRRLLAYHIVSQVGYMVCGVGVGTAMALNGATAHAFCHILYKGLLFMGAGAVLYSTGRQKLTDLGGLVQQMPVTFVLYMIGAFSISGIPLFNGFVSKSLVVTGAAEDHRALVVILLELASVGTFLSVALKLPYFAWFASPPKGSAREAPRHMLVAMAFTAALCVALGVAPEWLYQRLPYPPVDYHPYTAPHVFEMLLLPAFTGLAFWLLLKRLHPYATLTLDTDWLYRWPALRFVSRIAAPLDRFNARLGARIQLLANATVDVCRNPPLALQRVVQRGTGTDDTPMPGGDTEPLPQFDEDRQRPPVSWVLLWILTVFALLGVWFQAAAP